MATPAPVWDGKIETLVARVRTARAALCLATDPDQRHEILKELAAATQELSALVLGDTYPRFLPALVSILEMKP